MLKQRRFATFYLLTFLLLALIPLLSLIFNDGSMDFDAAAVAASEATGVEWNSNIINVARLSIESPLILLTVLGSAVPALAAVLVLLYSKQPHALRGFFSRLRPFSDVSAKDAAINYGLIFLLVIPLLLVYELRLVTGGDYSQGTRFALSLIPTILFIALLDQGAVLEELGWRGFATVELQSNGIQPLNVALIVGLCWGLWHVPRDVTTGVIERLGTFDYLFLYLPAFILGTLSVSVIASYFMNRLGGSVIPAIMVHGITNDSLGISGTATIIEALTPYHQMTKSVIFVIIALIIIFMTKGKLGFLDKTKE